MAGTSHRNKAGASRALPLPRTIIASRAAPVADLYPPTGVYRLRHKRNTNENEDDRARAARGCGWPPSGLFREAGIRRLAVEVRLVPRAAEFAPSIRMPCIGEKNLLVR
ncbi:MAG: hypothetical protein A49_28630 [Methyloceanibacter sp.]|nr:MAG: hypothetical protein A49_28630 [Methyloceanibacter sp.]